MIKVEAVSKRFGNREVLHEVSFEVAKGEILGFLGPNGAGKTTTLRILTGVFPPDSGRVIINGQDLFKQPLAVKGLIGYLPEHNPLYPEMTVEGYLRFAAAVKGVSAKDQTKRVNEVIMSCGLQDVRHRIIKRLSKGYKQRVGLAQALVNDPEVLFLDEPTVGLDPKQIIEIRQLIKRLSAQKTVVLSTHILPEVTMICDKVVIINKGQVVAADTVQHLTSQPGQIEVLVKGAADKIKACLQNMPSVKEVHLTPENGLMRCLIYLAASDDLRPQIAATLVNEGIDIYEMRPYQRSLEEVFVQLTTKEAS